MEYTLDAIGPIQQVVIQPTPFCNLDCHYCYLPDRGNRNRMTPETAARAMTRVFESGRCDSVVELRWHAGEPLTVPPEFYRDAIGRIRTLTPPGVAVRHTLQTNGTLIDERWCKLFDEESVEVGLSIDGPAFLHDRNRVTRSGHATHALALRGAQRLREHGVPFSVIAVLTDASLDHPTEIYEFFAALAPTRVGFNLEETEGANRAATLDVPNVMERYRTFLAAVYEMSRDGRVRIREFDALREAIIYGSGDRRSRTATPGALLCISWRGDATAFSPELQGIEHPNYGSFIFGNIIEQRLEDIFATQRFGFIADEIAAGVKACKASCAYFTLCGGGAPSNKLGEHGTFRSTSTFHCTANIKAVVDIVLSDIEISLSGTGRAAHVS